MRQYTLNMYLFIYERKCFNWEHENWFLHKEFLIKAFMRTSVIFITKYYYLLLQNVSFVKKK